MFQIKLLPLIFILHKCYGDWVSEWMSPVQEQIKLSPARRTNDEENYGSQNLRMAPIYSESPEFKGDNIYLNAGSTSNDFRVKLDNTLKNAIMLSEILGKQITELTSREFALKDAIVNGRSGVSTVTVSTISQPPRTYIVRDGFWTLCNGVIQYPVVGQISNTNLFTELFSAPRCIGMEISSRPDPCVFNSVVKYETIPQQRRSEYVEDEYLCLRPAFNSTLERYLSVPRRIINETCSNGIVRSLAGNIMECGLRVLSEYTYYPHRSLATSNLPLEYCTEKDGSCKLITAWHISNATIENFEFLKNEPSFKKYFIKSGPYLDGDEFIL